MISLRAKIRETIEIYQKASPSVFKQSLQRYHSQNQRNLKSKP